MGHQVVWLKRDLRVRDHRPLARAAEAGPVVILYVYEPCVFEAPDHDPSHQVFINQSLEELERSLAPLGGHITYRRGSMVEVLSSLHDEIDIETLWSHEETGNYRTFERDQRVAECLEELGIRWVEIPQFGVFRPHGDRDGWAKRWDARMQEPLTAPPAKIVPVEGVDRGAICSPEELGLATSQKTEAMKGGEIRAWEVLESFLEERGVNYRKDMSSPVEGWTGCSRLSPYLAYGNISMRSTYQRMRERIEELREREKNDEPVDTNWFKSLSSFEGRLHWHCHFMQKLEDEPELEFRAMSNVFDDIRWQDWNQEYFDAWCEGRTGYPMVDACMRCLHATGWLNFRMRAMLVSFASYHLWLDWRPTARYLAKQFLDYEPGIHFTQFQMQSGVTGINAIRIYSPTKQVKDQDPDGVFIRKWVPELSKVPKKYLAEPATMPEEIQAEAGCLIGEDYPHPIVEHRKVYSKAKDRIWTVRKTPEAKKEADRVYQKHGSRRRSRG